MKLSSIFTKAATVLEESEWGQGMAENRPGKLCAGEAIGKVVTGVGIYDSFNFFFSTFGDTITAINDSPTSTKESMIGLLREAATTAKVDEEA